MQSTDAEMAAEAHTVGRRYLRGCLLVVLGGFVLSLGVFAIRSASASDAWQYLFWRAVGFTCALALVATLREHRNPFTQVAHLGAFAWAAAVAMAVSQITFISAVMVTTFAEVFFLCSLAPLLAAMLARPLLGERIGWLVLVAIALATAGVYVMTGGRLDTGNWLGRTLSIVSAVSFAAYTLATRGSSARDLDAALITVGLLTSTASFTAIQLHGLPLVASPLEAGIGLLHGALILSAGLFLFGQGSRDVPGVTFTMLAQAEAVLSPVWGYLCFNENPTLGTIAGGGMILAAVVLQATAGDRGVQRDSVSR